MLSPAPLRAEIDETSLSVLTRKLRLPVDAFARIRWQTAFHQPKASSPRGPAFRRIDLARVGQDRLLVRLVFDQSFDPATCRLNFYLDLDDNRETGRTDATHQGVDLAVALVGGSERLLHYHPDFQADHTGLRMAFDQQQVWITIQLKNKADQLAWPLRAYGLIQVDGGGHSHSTPQDREVQLSESTHEVPSLRTVASYRHRSDRVQLEALENKGLERRAISLHPNFHPLRPRPDLPLATKWSSPAHAQPQNQDLVQAAPAPAAWRIPLHLQEELGIERSQTLVRFGFPLPQGKITDLHQLQLQRDDGTALPATFTITSFWPDQSARWALVESVQPLAAHEQATLYLAYQPAGHPHDSPDTLRVQQQEGKILVDNGILHAVIDSRRFNLISEVHLAGGSASHTFPQDGVELIDEHGHRFTTAALPPDHLTIERIGPTLLVIRAHGAYADARGNPYHRYQTRLTFAAGSSRIQITHTHLNDHLEHEFSDITSLTWPLGSPSQQVAALQVDAETRHLELARFLQARQWNERDGRLLLESAHEKVAPLAGVFQWTRPHGTVTLALEHFRERWPKGFTADERGLRLELLPRQPHSSFGEDLPDHLRYGFVQGHYRSKWGMAFTERFTLDFSHGKPDPERAAELHADTHRPAIAIVPSHWYAQTQALGHDALVPPNGEQFALWDNFVQRSYHALIERNHRDRAFGYFNYGDWYGERGRNWGNNEYDTAQNFFLQFARTGNRDYFRFALNAARHQADVDIVHAYPDPYYIGANHQHSIGHTGQWSQVPTHAAWSHRYDAHTSAANGHTWADGLVMAWQIAGEPRAGEAALALAEHITWAMAPSFQVLGSHERTAGWSLRAILALYRMLPDPAYLEAARHIAHVAMREQDLDDTGVWPHPLPAGHADGRTDLEGNNLYLMGILLGGLKSYHQETGDPAAEKAIVAAADWVARAWDPLLQGWPYSALRDASPIQRANTALNPLIATSMAYAGTIGHRPAWLQIAQDALQALFAFDTQQAMGKDVSIRMYFVPEALALIQRWQAAERPEAAAWLLDGSNRSMTGLLAGTPAAPAFSLRAPDQKIFHVQLEEADETLLLTRTRHGALARRLPATQVRILDASGKLLREERYVEDPQAPLSLQVSAAAGEVLTVVVQDDQRAIWHLAATSGKVVAEVGPEFRLGAVRRSRYTVFVPAGTSHFSIRILGVHTGMYGAAVLRPNGEMAAFYSGHHSGVALLPTTAAEERKNERPLQTLEVQVPVQQSDAFWHLILWAAGDLGLAIDGIPPVIAQSESSWFLPPALGRKHAAARSAGAVVNLVTIGDSTVASYNPDRTVMRGWGQLMQEQLVEGAGAALNHASSGHSSKSFLRQGLWQQVLDRHPRPDYVLIQFGHNDVTGKGPERETIPDPVPTPLPGGGPGALEDDWYRNNLHRYIREAREAGITPVIVSPMERANFLSDGKVRPTNRRWALAAAAVAEETGVVLIDLNRYSAELLPQLDEAAVTRMQFINPDGSVDRTHFSEAGARTYAQFVAQALREAIPPLREVIREVRPSQATAH